MSNLLTISIPTFNRHKLFYNCLSNIKNAIENLSQFDQNLITVFISDNSDNNFTELIVNSVKFENLNIIYIRNEYNIGSDQNISNCFTIPKSEYVMIIGDDDFLSLYSLKNIFNFLKTGSFDLIFLKAYGLTNVNSEIRNEDTLKYIVFNGIKEVLHHRHIHLTFISTTIFRKTNVTSQEINKSVGTSFVQLYFIFLLFYKNAKCLYLNANYISATRNNTDRYDVFEMFITNFFTALNQYNNFSLSKKELKNLKLKILNTFYVRSFGKYLKENKLKITSKQLYLLDQNFNSYFLYKFIYRKCFLKINIFNYNVLMFFYIYYNIIYYPNRLFDFLYHIKNHLKTKINLS